MSDRTAVPFTGTTPTVASALLLDDSTLAALARTTLAAADLATVVGGAPEQVQVVDRDGEPELRGLSETLLAQVGRGRRTTLIVSPRLDDGVWLVLDGRLVARDGATALAVEAVWVGCPQGHGHARPLDLTEYATAVPDVLRAGIPRLLEHTNAGHGPELRDLARRRLGLDAQEIAGAVLTDLDVDGVTLRVVDLDGGSQVRLPFARRATAPCDLLGLLRLVLTAP